MSGGRSDRPSIGGISVGPGGAAQKAMPILGGGDVTQSRDIGTDGRLKHE